MKDFKKKIVWITGASSGIGAEMARQCNNLGATVILSARRIELLEQLKNSLKKPENAFVLTLDMENPEAFAAKVAEVIEKYGRVDVLFHNAGISQRSLVSETSLEVDKRLMDVNYFGPVALTKALLPYLQKQQESHIVVNSSLAGKFGFYLRSAYSASKFALHGFFETLRLEEADNNLSVTIACPVSIKTELSQSALVGDGKTFGEKTAAHEVGISADECVRQIIAAIESDQTEIIIGQKAEPFSVLIKTLAPKLFWKLIKKQKPY